MQSDDQTLTPPKGINNNNKNSRTCPCKKYNKRLRVLWKPINAETTTNTERRRSKAINTAQNSHFRSKPLPQKCRFGGHSHIFLSTKCQINLGRRSHFSNHKEVGHYGIRLIKIKRADSIQCAFHSISAIFSERSPSAA